MAATNTDKSQDMITKIASLVVAIVVLACVLVPVCEAMTDTGGGGGDSTGKVYINDLQDIYAEMGEYIANEAISTPYHSYQIYKYTYYTYTADNEEIVNTLYPSSFTEPISYNLETLRELEIYLDENISNLPDGFEIEILRINAQPEPNYGVYISVMYSNDGLEFKIVDGNSGYDGLLTDDARLTWESIEFTVNIDFSCEINVTFTFYGTQTQTHTITSSSPAMDVYEISTLKDGWTFLHRSLYYEGSSVAVYLNFGENTNILDESIWVYTEDDYWYGAEYGMRSTSEYEIVGNTLTIPFEDEYSIGYTGSISCAVTKDSNGYWRISGYMEWLNDMPDASNPFTSAQVKDENGNSIAVLPDSMILYAISTYDGGSGSGTSTGSNASGSGNGTANTLIGIIPVFVALGLILAIVSIFYDPNRFE